MFLPKWPDITTPCQCQFRALNLIIQISNGFQTSYKQRRRIHLCPINTSVCLWEQHNLQNNLSMRQLCPQLLKLQYATKSKLNRQIPGWYVWQHGRMTQSQKHNKRAVLKSDTNSKCLKKNIQFTDGFKSIFTPLIRNRQFFVQNL